MKTFAQRKMQKIKEELKKGGELQKELKTLIRENKEAYKETNSNAERLEIVQMNNQHRAEIQESRLYLTALHQEYNRLKGRANSHETGFLVQAFGQWDRFEYKAYVVHLDYDSFELAETTHMMEEKYLAGKDKIYNQDILAVFESKNEATRTLEILEERIEGTPEMKEIRGIMEDVAKAQEEYEKRKKELDSEIERLKRNFSQREDEGTGRRRKMRDRKQRLTLDIKNIKTAILEEYKNADK